MVQKMPGVAFLALQQFYAEDPANRKRYCYLNYLEKKLLPDEEVRVLLFFPELPKIDIPFLVAC